MMQIQTARFGTIEMPDEELIRFPKRILGFEGVERFVLVPHNPDSPFMFLQAVDEPNLTFVVTDPTWFLPGYQVRVVRDDLRWIDFGDGDDVAILAIVRVPERMDDMTANLLAPLVINSRTRLGKQVVQQDSSYVTRHRIADELERMAGEERSESGDEATHSARLVTVG